MKRDLEKRPIYVKRDLEILCKSRLHVSFDTCHIARRFIDFRTSLFANTGLICRSLLTLIALRADSCLFGIIFPFNSKGNFRTSLFTNIGLICRSLLTHFTLHKCVPFWNHISFQCYEFFAGLFSMVQVSFDTFHIVLVYAKTRVARRWVSFLGLFSRR